jgi:hypothetical protein
MNKNFNDIKKKPFMDIDSDEEFKNYTTEALPLAGVGIIAAAILALVGVITLIWKLIGGKSENIDDGIEQVLKKQVDYAKLIDNYVGKFKKIEGGDKSEDIGGWTKRDVLILEKKFTEADLKTGIRDLEKKSEVVVAAYKELDKNFFMAFNSKLDNIIKHTEKLEKADEKDTKEIAKQSENISKDADAIRAIFEKHIEAFSHKTEAEFIKKLDSGFDHKWSDFKNDSQSDINDNIKQFYEKFKGVLSALSEKQEVSFDDLEKAGALPRATPEDVLKKGKLTEKLKSINLEKVINDLESKSKSIDSKFKDNNAGAKEAKELIKEVRSCLILFSTSIKVLSDTYLSFIGLYNRYIPLSAATIAVNKIKSDVKTLEEKTKA